MNASAEQAQELEIIEYAGRIAKRPKNGVSVQSKGSRWQIYFGYDRHGKAVRKTISCKERAEQIRDQFEERWAANEKVQVQQFANFSTDAKSYALIQELKAQGHTLQEAVDWFFKWMPSRQKQLTLPQAWLVYEKEMRNLGKGDRHIESMGANYCGPKSKFYKEFQDKMLHHISPDMIKGFILSNKKENMDAVAGWTRNNMRTHRDKLHQFFRKMVELKHLKTNPCADVPRPKNKRGEDPAAKKFYANYDAIFSMLECCIGKSNHDSRRQMGLAIILVVWGGIRLEETVRLCWRDFTKNKDGRWVVTILDEDTKSFRRVNTLPAATSTWVDQIVALLANNYELKPEFPIISERSDSSKELGEKDIKQRQKRFRHSWKEWAAANDDSRYEDPKTVKQNGLRHACGCYGFHKLGQDKLMLLMGEKDAKVIENHYRRYAPPEEADALYNTPSPLVQEAKAKENAEREKAILSMMDTQGLSRADAEGAVDADVWADAP